MPDGGDEYSGRTGKNRRQASRTGQDEAEDPVGQGMMPVGPGRIDGKPVGLGNDAYGGNDGP